MNQSEKIKLYDLYIRAKHVKFYFDNPPFHSAHVETSGEGSWIYETQRLNYRYNIYGEELKNADVVKAKGLKDFKELLFSLGKITVKADHRYLQQINNLIQDDTKSILFIGSPKFKIDESKCNVTKANATHAREIKCNATKKGEGGGGGGESKRVLG